MKVILLQELKGRGGEGDVVEVARGFAVNYLLPRKIAIEATKGNIKQLGQRSHNIQKREDQRLADADALAVKLNGQVVTVQAKVGEEGRLFGSVTHAHIEEALLEQLGVEVDRRKIETHGTIKEAGPRVIEVSIYRDIKAELTVNVVAEGAAPATPIVETVVAEVEGVSAEGEAFVEVVEETPEQEEADVALEEAAEAESEGADEAEAAAEETTD
jgi:large subunit ribosomal protein L9